ncbi:MAG: hypothetical protein IJ757_03065 [Clostridiales bacterium]|nr:hypothetical protein [Clostridiales bacterium]
MIAEMDLAVNNLINTFFISRGLGDNGTAAYQIVAPCFMLVCAFIALMYNGVQAVCSKDYGSDDKEKFNCHKNSGYTWTILIMITLSILFFVFKSPILDILGANDSDAVVSELCSECYLMFLPCFVLQGFFSIASCLLFLNEKKALLIANVVLYTFLISGNYIVLNYAVSMTGFIAVNAVGEAAADVFLILYWMIKRKESVSAFTAIRLATRDVKEAILTGLPDFMEYAFAAALSLLLNLYMLARFSSSVLAGFGVFEAVENIPELICVGFCFLFTSAFGIKVGRIMKAYNPEQKEITKKDLGDQIMSITRLGIISALIISAIMIIISRPVVALFFKGSSDQETINSAILIIISYSIGFVFYILNSEFVCYYKVVKALWQAHIIFFVEALAFPLMSRIILGELLGVVGFCFGGVLAEVMTFVINICIVWKSCGHFPKRINDFLMEKYL